jgi:hypothetical protein
MGGRGRGVGHRVEGALGGGDRGEGEGGAGAGYFALWVMV